VPLSNFVPRGFGFVHHSRAILYHEVPHPNLTTRNFLIAVAGGALRRAVRRGAVPRRGPGQGHHHHHAAHRRAQELAADGTRVPPPTPPPPSNRCATGLESLFAGWRQYTVYPARAVTARAECLTYGARYKYTCASRRGCSPALGGCGHESVNVYIIEPARGAVTADWLLTRIGGGAGVRSRSPLHPPAPTPPPPFPTAPHRL
jgi:hypothetical protein